VNDRFEWVCILNVWDRCGLIFCSLRGIKYENYVSNFFGLILSASFVRGRREVVGMCDNDKLGENILYSIVHLMIDKKFVISR
jgi:hypothetical protein